MLTSWTPNANYDAHTPESAAWTCSTPCRHDVDEDGSYTADALGFTSQYTH